MADEPMSADGRGTDPSGAASLPPSVDRAVFEAKLAELRVREKAHTREGDTIASARRHLPMVEVDATLPLIGPLMDLTVWGRQEPWEASPAGWPQKCTSARTETGPPTWTPVLSWPSGRPIAQWSRIEAGRSDNLTADPAEAS
ncbi:DUF899 family protein [Actinoplanes sp. NPDC051343]|uniref:DUF899 family protein n=1 Tax=Actinoplanes sp. NPDC051343 TaxID=3363906 RepID=UPI0037941F1A